MSANRLSKLVSQQKLNIILGGFCLLADNPFDYQSVEATRLEGMLWDADGSRNRMIFSLKYSGERSPGGD